MKDTSKFYKFFSVRASALNDNKELVRGTGHVCVAVQPSVRNPKSYRVAVSFKSPADKLNRELGMKIAEGRLISSRPGRNFRINAKNLDSAFDTALDTLFTKSRKVFRKGKAVARPFVPDWLHQAVVEREHRIQALK